MVKNEYVSIVKANVFEYPDVDKCFWPDENYPENPFPTRNINSKNKIYKAVRESLHILKMDEEHYGSKEWNPFKDIIHVGDTVLVKPNLVMDKNLYDGNTDCLYTQPSVVAPIIDYIAIALNNTGKIIIGDAPMQECDFDNLLNQSGYIDLLAFYKARGLNIDIVDFREIKSIVKRGVHIQEVSNNARGKIIDLKEDSEFFGYDSKRIEKMRITNYDPRILNKHHTVTKHEYYVADTLLDADVLINMPKPKSHRKAGVTISLKNMVGINIRKEFLPHHTLGAMRNGGDEYKEQSKIHQLRSYIDDKINEYSSEKRFNLARLLQIPRIMCSVMLKLMHQQYSEGSWYGNKTISKTISDINKIVYYADKQGNMQNSQQRKIFILADMIISGEKEGPVRPDSKPVGIIAAGFNPVIFDEVVATLMGFDYRKIPAIEIARKISKRYKLVDTEKALIKSNFDSLSDIRLDEFPKEEILDFIPTSGWQGHIELNK